MYFKNQFYLFITLISLFSLNANAQLNIPAHFAYIKEGVYKEFSRDSSEVFEQKVEAFYMYKFEVSGMDYKRFLQATNQTIPKDLDLKRPVINVTYYNAKAYCNWLSENYNVNFRLPTKQEWEYAAKAGNFENEDFIYNRELPNEHVIYIGNSKDKPSCISCIQPNEFGLYGMVGNVWEWTEQQFKGTNAFIVGGSFFEDENHVKATTKKEINMNHKQKDLGFRFVVNASEFKKLVKK